MKLWKHQEIALEHLMLHPYAGLFLDMGSGKTLTTLIAISRLLEKGDISRVLILAPVRVANYVWKQELEECKADFPELRNLSMTIATGAPKDRVKGLKDLQYNVCVTSRDTIQTDWAKLKASGSDKNFNALVIDEVSGYKSFKSKRFKFIQTIHHQFHRVIGLTGTPLTSGYENLYGLMTTIDGGIRFGYQPYDFLNKYFYPKERRGYIVYSWGIDKENKEKIMDKMKECCLHTDNPGLQLPGFTESSITIPSSAKLTGIYEELRDEFYTKIRAAHSSDGLEKEVVADSAAVLTMKLQQLANGFLYKEEVPGARETINIDMHKLDTVKELIPEMNGNTIIAYYFKRDLELLEKEFKSMGCMKLTDPGAIDKWNRGEVPILLLHPASGGHGLNLPKGGNNLIWYSLPWDLELFEQTQKRLYRPGQTKTVHSYYLLTEGTVDNRILDALKHKSNIQKELLKWTYQ